MSTQLLTDAELHELIMARQATRTREEWQEWLDEVKEAFDRQEATERAYVRNGSYVKAKSATKSSRKITQVVAD